MPLKLYNTLTRKKEAFKPISAKQVTMYSCGPTVYSFAHIGNMRRYVFDDVLKRTLVFDGYKLKDVMNVTDVGHLTSDADEGEDKMEKAAAKEGKSAEQIANFYWKAFREDFKKLNIIEPQIWSKATEHIKEQLELLKKLDKKGYTYRTADGIYFDTSKFKNYGKLAKLNIEGLEAGKRIDLGDKKNKTDFALWKFSEENGKRQQEWNPKEFGSNWPVGFPGWHLECSAMAMKYLGETIDIHTGGEDNLPIHHTNEVAQSESANGKKFVNYWLHSAFLTLKGEKISKSKGGLFTISELEEKGYVPLAFRYLCLTAHYKTQLDFSLDNLQASQNSYERLKKIVSELKDDGKTNKEYIAEFQKAIDDDLNTSSALQVLWKLVRSEKAEGKVNTIKEFEKVLALDLFKKEEVKIPAEVAKLAEEREKARKNKEWKKSDELRDKIKELGFLISDTNEGYRLGKI